MNQIQSVLENQRGIITSFADTCGFITTEAKRLMEYCIELNNQDDRNAHPDDPDYQADFGDWIKEYDSRDGLGNDPATNGFGPFRNAWILLRNQEKEREYALAIRGTIGQAKSILDDFLVTTISAYGGVEFPKNTILPIAFAATPKAEVHLGFAYAAFTLLFDKNRGILKQLLSGQIPADSRLLITGHSQGAAIATLVHAFLHYAITDPSDRYGLARKGLRLKSYVFAQPKPGNFQFAMDFAHIAGSRGAGFVINNSLDPVTMLPLTTESLAESISETLDENQMKGAGFKGVLITEAVKASSVYFRGRNEVAELIGDNVAKLYHQNEMQMIDAHYFEGIPSLPDRPVQSLNYALSGALVPLFGDFKGGTLYPPTGTGAIDLLLQHHAPTYRKLLNRQFK